jgi:hypothetical protein
VVAQVRGCRIASAHMDEVRALAAIQDRRGRRPLLSAGGDHTARWIVVAQFNAAIQRHICTDFWAQRPTGARHVSASPQETLGTVLIRRNRTGICVSAGFWLCLYGREHPSTTGAPRSRSHACREFRRDFGQAIRSGPPNLRFKIALWLACRLWPQAINLGRLRACRTQTPRLCCAFMSDSVEHPYTPPVLPPEKAALRDEMLADFVRDSMTNDWIELTPADDIIPAHLRDSLPNHRGIILTAEGRRQLLEMTRRMRELDLIDDHQLKVMSEELWR